MSFFSTRLMAFQDRVADTLADMSPRDRNLLLGLVAVATLALVIGGSWWMNSTIHDLRSRVSSRKDTLHMIEVMAQDHKAAIAKAEEIESQLQTYQGSDLSSFLEQTAKQAGIPDRLEAVREKSASTDDVLEEKVYAVSISALTLEEFSNFLFEAESAGFPMQILTMKIKTKSKGGEKMIYVDMDIAAYRVIAAETPASDDGGEG